MSERRFHVTIMQVVEVVIRDPSVVSRCVNNEDEWQEHFYPITTEREVIGHLAMNVNAGYVRKLDGWADLPEDAAVMHVRESEVDRVEEV